MSKMNLLTINDPEGELPDTFYTASLKNNKKYPIGLFNLVTSIKFLRCDDIILLVNIKQ